MSAQAQARSKIRMESLVVRHRWTGIALVLVIFLFAFSVRYATLTDMGVTWDEPAYVHAGIAYVGNILHGDLDPGAYKDNLEHPPVSKYLYGAAVWVFNGGREDPSAYAVAKTVSAVLGAAACLLVYLIGSEFFDRPTAVISALILALIPDFVAHTQIAAIDGPVAFFFTLTMYLFMKALKARSAGYYIASAISLGLLVDTKFTGLLALPVMAALFIVHRYMANQDNSASIFGLIRHYLPPVIGFFLISVSTAFLIYPWAWGGVGNLRLTLQHWTYVPREYFLGTYGPAPLGYYPIYFLATTPALLLLPLAAGAYYAARSRDPFKYAVLLWLILPFAYDLSYFKQDGMRYLLMIYPAAALLCGAGLSAAGGRIGVAMGGRWQKDAVSIALYTVTVAYLIVTLASVSPYYLDYYNCLSGSLPNVYEHKLFEVGWWGEGISDSMNYIEHNAPPGSSVYVAAKPQFVVQYYDLNQTYIQSTSDNMTLDYGLDYVLTNTFSDRYCTLDYAGFSYEPVYTTRVQGVPLARVLKRVY